MSLIQDIYGVFRENSAVLIPAGLYILSATYQKVKKWLFENAKDRWLFAGQTLIAGTAVVVQSIIGQSPDTLQSIGGKWAMVIAGLSTVYHLPFIGIKDVSSVLTEAKKWREAQKVQQPASADVMPPLNTTNELVDYSPSSNQEFLSTSGQ